VCKKETKMKKIREFKFSFQTFSAGDGQQQQQQTHQGINFRFSEWARDLAKEIRFPSFLTGTL